MLKNPEFHTYNVATQPDSNCSHTVSFHDLRDAVNRFKLCIGLEHIKMDTLKNGGPIFEILIFKLMNKFPSQFFFPQTTLKGEKSTFFKYGNLN